MKKSILYILLLTYTSMMCKPLLPYVADAIGHALSYKQHMATVHFEQGRFHVHKESLEAAKQNSDTTKTPAVQKEISWDHILTVVPVLSREKLLAMVFPEYRLAAPASIIADQPVPPPRR